MNSVKLLFNIRENMTIHVNFNYKQLLLKKGSCEIGKLFLATRMCNIKESYKLITYPDLLHNLTVYLDSTWPTRFRRSLIIIYFSIFNNSNYIDLHTVQKGNKLQNICSCTYCTSMIFNSQKYKSPEIKISN